MHPVAGNDGATEQQRVAGDQGGRFDDEHPYAMTARGKGFLPDADRAWLGGLGDGRAGAG